MKVVILGAGASAGYDKSNIHLKAPVARNFFKKAMVLWERDCDRDRFQNLFKFLERYYSFNLTRLRNENLDIEEVLTILETNKLKIERKELLEFIYLSLNKILFGEYCPYHRDLVESLGREDAIISFNWDLLVDNALAKKCRQDEMPNYGISFTGTYKSDDWHDRLNNRGPRLIKLHGSLNWLECVPCKNNFCYVDRGKVVAEQITTPDDPRLKCPKCSQNMTPVIIPPTLFKYKAYQRQIFKQLWQQAENVLRKAEEVIIIGYSLPVTDFKAKWLLMSSVAKRNYPLHCLTVIDKFPENCLFEKYRNIFGVQQANMRTITGEIKDYANELLQATH